VRVRSTYRIQLTPDFGFDHAAGVAEYLARLGVSHLYSSPSLQAAPGSRHGYDVVDHSRVNAELGGDGAHTRMSRELGRVGLGQVLDIVANHMAIAGRSNRWWWDVLENGPSSRYATYFDVAWDPPEEKLRNTILMPVLGDHYGRELEAGRLRLDRDGARLVVRHHEREFPIDPRTYGLVLGDGFEGLGVLLAALPVVPPADRPGALRRHLQKEALLAQLARAETADELDARIGLVNIDPDRLDGLLEQQNYRLARWQTASAELDYRRFFDVDNLAALRMEDPDVFADTHVLVLEWLHRGILDGLRIDHLDGLRDPLAYLQHLARAEPGAWIVVEKILQPSEELPDRWPVAGTTGYDFLNRALGLFVDPAGEAPMTAAYERFTGVDEPFAEVAYRGRHQVMRDLLASDMRRLTQLFAWACEGNRRYRDYTRPELSECLHEVIACLGVYRTYVRAGRPASVTDRSQLGAALAEARRRRPDLEGELFELLGRILLNEHGVRTEQTEELAARFQQTSGPVAAKGVEDTAMYRYHRLVALNEVGGDPGRFGVSADAFHAACNLAADRWPDGMLALSTHDTKRSEDVRARLAVLSEIPGVWEAAVTRWGARNERHRRDGLPDRNVEYLLYQTLVGAWPIGADRLLPYLEKAVREAKAHTSWLAPSAPYEAAVSAFAAAVLEDAAFVEDVATFVAVVTDAGRVNSLSMKLLCLTAPGAGDIYQGTELWDLSLVDPDNRRPVDFALRSRLLTELDAAEGVAATLAWARRDEGLPKLLVVSRALRFRRERPDLFDRASYRALAVTGARAEHVVAFCRGEGAATIVPRLVAGLERAGGWADTAVALPEGSWVDRLTGRPTGGGQVALADALADFPVALLERLA
jgi:(1->4)-alpha-D-glucan 1-alpha-D-glucosylmutase